MERYLSSNACRHVEQCTIGANPFGTRTSE